MSYVWTKQISCKLVDPISRNHLNLQAFRMNANQHNFDGICRKVWKISANYQKLEATWHRSLRSFLLIISWNSELNLCLFQKIFFFYITKKSDEINFFWPKIPTVPPLFPNHSLFPTNPQEMEILWKFHIWETGAKRGGPIPPPPFLQSLCIFIFCPVSLSTYQQA